MTAFVCLARTYCTTEPYPSLLTCECKIDPLSDVKTALDGEHLAAKDPRTLLHTGHGDKRYIALHKDTSKNTTYKN